MDEMGKQCGTHGEMKSSYQVLPEVSMEEDSRRVCGREDNIKVGFREIQSAADFWIESDSS